MSVIYPVISDVCFFQRIPIDLVRMVFEMTNFSLSEEVKSDLQSIRASTWPGSGFARSSI
jgi:hypothetical protein